jgi:putative ABC transport system permease protein
MNLLAELREGLAIAFAAIRANKLRAGLTTLGIVIGVVTVTLMGTAIEGLDRYFQKTVGFIAADTLYVRRMPWMIHSHAEWMRLQKRRPIEMSQVRELARLSTLARAVAPVSFANQPVSYKNRKSTGVDVIGTTDQFQYTSGIPVAEGRFFTPIESEGARPVCVIGAQVATNLFVREDPLGKRIKIGQIAFDVVGVLQAQGSFLGAFNLDKQVIIPLGQIVAFRWRPDYDIQVRARDLASVPETLEEVRAHMRTIRRVPPGEPDDFAINQQEQFLRIFKSITTTIATVGLFITGLSLFVGGIGIMNIMFVSVAERTREIGIRKAIGAKRRTILVQFLIEAAGICLMGGALALAIAWPMTLVLARFLPAVMSLQVAGLALLVSTVTGLIAGFFPAWRAARMNPVDALRNE